MTSEREPMGRCGYIPWPAERQQAYRRAHKAAQAREIGRLLAECTLWPKRTYVELMQATREYLQSVKAK